MKFKILMFGKGYVDRTQLNHGIYASDTPELYPEDATIEEFVQRAEQVQTEMRINLVNYIANLKKCTLVECDLHLSIDSSAPVINDEFLADVRELVDYDYESEQEHYNALGEDVRECHIFNSIKRLNETLKAVGK